MRVPFMFLLVLTGGFSTVSAQAKKTIPVSTSVKVPEIVQSNFSGQFTVLESTQWKQAYNGNYLAHFTNNMNQVQVVEYEPGGKIIKKKTSYPLSGLPEHIKAAIVGTYPEMNITACTRLEMIGVHPFYKATVAHVDLTIKELLISEEGTISE